MYFTALLENTYKPINIINEDKIILPSQQKKYQVLYMIRYKDVKVCFVMSKTEVLNIFPVTSHNHKKLFTILSNKVDIVAISFLF